MKRSLVLVAGLFAALFLVVPSAFADEPSLQHTGRVIISTGGDVTIPAGDHVDLVMVVDGVATVAGEANTVVAINGQAHLTGATVETVVAIRSSVDLAAGTRVLGDVMALDSPVVQGPAAEVQGSVRDLAPEIANLSLILAPAAILLYVGFAVAAVAAGLLVAGLASRQVRAAEQLIREEPVATIVAGIVGLIAPVFVALLLAVTVVGAPLAAGIVFGLWPLAAFVGYLVAGIAIGEWILRRTSPGVERERPYLAAVVGILALEVLTLVPFVGPIATLVGFGAVLLLAWRVLRSGSAGADTTLIRQTPAAAST